MKLSWIVMCLIAAFVLQNIVPASGQSPTADLEEIPPAPLHTINKTGIKGQALYHRPQGTACAPPLPPIMPPVCVSGAMLILSDNSGKEICTQFTNQKGEFNFDVEPGSYKLNSKWGNYSYSKAVTVLDGQITDLHKAVFSYPGACFVN